MEVFEDGGNEIDVVIRVETIVSVEVSGRRVPMTRLEETMFDPASDVSDQEAR